MSILIQNMWPLLLKIYDAASMQRWNDQIRTVDLTELDKQAHKMIIAYVLGKSEENIGIEKINWIEIIEAGIFEFLQRIILTDLKPALFHRIKEDKEKYERLNQWVYKRIIPFIIPLGEGFCSRFKSYLMDRERNVDRRIISAAHFYSTKWEFDVIERANPQGYSIEEIRKDLDSKQEKYHDLKSMQILLQAEELKDFIDLCAQLRFQIRWSHMHMVPKISVLGHMLIVAMFTYLFSLRIGVDDQRAIKNYFTGLFHDLPEVLTRDVISPVKRSVEGLTDLIKEYEREEMEKKIYKLIPAQWHKDMKMFTEDEFDDLIVSNGDKIERDGKLVKAADDLAAYIESWLSLKNGIQNKSLDKAGRFIREKYKFETISDIDFGKFYKKIFKDDYGIKKILFLCTGNSCRSQMAEGLMKYFGGERFEVFSAGSASIEVNPLSIRVLREIGVDISGQKLKHLKDFLGKKFDYVVTVCNNAKQICPVFPGDYNKEHWDLYDPDSVEENEEEKIKVFRDIRDKIKENILLFLEKLD